jgi:hypothetical protein
MPRGEEHISEFKQRVARNGAAFLDRMKALARPLGAPVRGLGSKVAALDRAMLNLGAEGLSREQLLRRKLIYRRLLAAVSALAGISVFSGVGARALSNLVGLLYPLYRSFKALRSPEPGDDKQWLCYWLLFGSSCVAESFIGFVLDRLGCLD